MVHQCLRSKTLRCAEIKSMEVSHVTQRLGRRFMDMWPWISMDTMGYQWFQLPFALRIFVHVNMYICRRLSIIPIYCKSLQLLCSANSEGKCWIKWARNLFLLLTLAAEDPTRHRPTRLGASPTGGMMGMGLEISERCPKV